MTQQGLARQLPGTVDGNQVSRWERGLHKPSDETLELIAGILGVDYSYFVRPNEPVKDATPDLMEAVNGNVEQVGSTVDDIRTEFRGRVDQLDEGIAEIKAQLSRAMEERRQMQQLIDTQNANLAEQSNLLRELSEAVKLLPAIQAVLDALPPADDEDLPAQQPGRDIEAGPAAAEGSRRSG